MTKPRGPAEMAAEWNQLNPDRTQDVQALFDLWVTHYRTNAKAVRLGPKRERKIQMALDSHGYDTCRAAILGIQHSDFHMGRNRQRKRYDEISLILRDEEHIERFAELDERFAEHGNISDAALDFLND